MIKHTISNFPKKSYATWQKTSKTRAETPSVGAGNLAVDVCSQYPSGFHNLNEMWIHVAMLSTRFFKNGK